MNEKSVLYNEHMVRDVINGTKTQMRRIMKDQPTFAFHPMNMALETDYTARWYTPGIVDKDGYLQPAKKQVFGVAGEEEGYSCPFGAVGDQLYVREAFSRLESFNFFNPAVPYEVPDFWYWADGDPKWGNWTRPQSGAVMPKAASRIRLEITGARIERLRDASENELLDELGDMLDYDNTVAGRAFSHAEHYAIAGVPVGMCPEMHGFRAWWDKTNGYGSFDSNPWVWVINFKRVEAPE